MNDLYKQIRELKAELEELKSWQRMILLKMSNENAEFRDLKKENYDLRNRRD